MHVFQVPGTTESKSTDVPKEELVFSRPVCERQKFVGYYLSLGTWEEHGVLSCSTAGKSQDAKFRTDSERCLVTLLLPVVLLQILISVFFGVEAQVPWWLSAKGSEVSHLATCCVKLIYAASIWLCDYNSRSPNEAVFRNDGELCWKVIWRKRCGGCGNLGWGGQEKNSHLMFPSKYR